MINTQYNKEENIIFITQMRSIGLAEALEALQYLQKEYHHLDKIYILEDSRNSTFKFKTTDLQVLLNAIKTMASGFKEVRHADMMDNPFNTALAYLYAQLASQIQNYTYKPFSTEKAALKWLKKGIYYDE